ncbi:unnamed protein product [Gongylonema pulchrum]|uniref:TAFII55_N domain-containing protein n=1 Tax=Gongylonema pulchrum TaxID=637853 RepID=A0A183E1T9_9BILA|nr:unnamed protein product [Gongylonema pulchrum]
MLIQLFRLSFALQSLALESSFGFSGSKRIAVHNLVAKYLNFSSQLMAIPSLCQHVQQIVKQRALRGHPSLNLLPEAQSSRNKDPNMAPLAYAEDEEQAALCLEEDATVLFDIDDVSEMLKTTGKDVKNLAVPFVSKGAALASSISGDMLPGDWTFRGRDKGDYTDGTETSGIDENTVSLDMSIDWSPPESIQTSRKNTIFLPAREIDINEEEKREQKRTQEILKKFRTQDFNKLVEEMHQEREEVDLSRTVKRLLQRNDDANRINEYGYRYKPKNIFELKLPESFVF